MVRRALLEREIRGSNPGPAATCPHEHAWVPLNRIIGCDAVPWEAANVIRAALAEMRKRDEVSPNALWQAIEFWAADYLAEGSFYDEDSDEALG